MNISKLRKYQVLEHCPSSQSHHLLKLFWIFILLILFCKLDRFILSHYFTIALEYSNLQIRLHFCEIGIRKFGIKTHCKITKMSKIEIKNKCGETHCHENECCGSSEIEEFEIHPIWLTVYLFYWFALLKILRCPFSLTAISYPCHFHFCPMLRLSLR